MRFLTVDEVALRLRITSETVREMIRSRRIKATKVGKWLVEEKDITLFIEKNSNFNGNANGDRHG